MHWWCYLVQARERRHQHLAQQTRRSGVGCDRRQIGAAHHDTADTDTGVNRARLRANLVAMHLWAPDHLPPTSLEAYFVAGSVVRAQARRTSAGWRVAEVAVTPTWRSGSGVSAMIATR